MSKIFITGCAKSGTTMLQFLFHAFKDMNVYQHQGNEVPLNVFVHLKSAKDNVVGKRAAPCILSSDFEDRFLDMEMIIKNHNIKIINIVRNGFDVLQSDNGWVDEGRWISSMDQRRQFKDIIACEVFYEQIIAEPNKWQEHVAEKLGLEIEHQWSNYPSFVPAHVFGKVLSKGKNYKPRPLSTASIDKPIPSELRNSLSPYFFEHMEELGYETT